MDEEPPRKTNPAIFIIAGLAIAIGLAALVFAVRTPVSPPPETAATEAEAPASTNTTDTALPPDWTIVSGVASVKVAALAELPAAPTTPAEPDCADRTGAPQSPQARLAAAKGWKIVQESPLGSLTAVLIVSGYELGTSSTCFAKNGNIALFDGDRLVGIAYTGKGIDFQIGSFEARGPGLRIGTGTPGAPLGDLVVRDHAIRFDRLPASEKLCGDRRTVPNIYGLPIQEARRKLIAAGWKPVPSTEEAEFLTADLRNEGIVEVSRCAPTGYGQCGFNYAAGGDRLDVGSVGDQPVIVTDYSVECR